MSDSTLNSNINPFICNIIKYDTTDTTTINELYLLEKANTFNPNPARDVIIAEHEIKNLTMYNLQGEVVFNEKIIDQFERIKLSNIKPGIYFLQYEHGSLKFHEK